MRILFTSIFLFFINFAFTQSYDIRFNRSSVNCATRQVCYDVQLRPNGGSTFNLAGQNYRIFYNSATASYTNGTSLLPSQYGDFTLVQDVQGANADAVNGLLSFEATLGFLNYSMDLNDTQNGGIVLAAGQWTTTSNLCFNVTPEVINNPNSCIELVWGREALTTPYATAFVEVSRWTGPNVTTNSSGVLYDDLNSSDGDGACFNTACPSTVGENTIALCQDGIDNDGDGNTDCEDADCLAISNLDCDQDGNPNGNDPNPTIPVAVNDAFTAPVAVSTNFNILSNDNFLPGANTSITRTGGNAGGTVAFNGSTGNISYTPLASEAGSIVTVNYQVCNTVPNPDVCATATINITVPAVNPSNDYNIRMVLKNVNCTTNQFCYTVQLSSANGNAMNLAGQNYRLYYDGSKMSYLSGISLLPGAQYTSYTLVQNIENQNAGAINGPLTFEDHLSFLNYTMDLNDVVNGGITLPANGSWVSTSELCFQGSFSVTATPMTCIEAVWGRNGLTNAYATAYVEVAKWISANNTQMAMGVNYDDITLNDTQNVCQVTDCDQDGNPNGNDPNPTTPVAVNDAFTAPVGVATSFNILSNDNFLPGANTSITRTGGNAGGTVAFNGSTGNISYTPLPSEAGSVVTVNYQVCNTVPNPDVCATATISITVPAVNPSSEYNIRMDLAEVDCETNQFCYNVQLSSANGSAMNLAGQNYRLYWDGSKMSYLSGTSTLPTPRYTPYTFVSNTENQNASVFGTLPFDAHLSFLNYTMDLNDTQNGGIVLPADGSWVTTSQLCFQSATDLSVTPLTCIEAVWGRDGLTNGYATAFVEVAEWESANVTGAAEGVGYEDITLSSQNNICQSTICAESGQYNIRMDLAEVDCETNQFCYNVQLSSANGSAMNLAGQNYRLYWDGSKMSYLSGTSTLPTPRYTPYTFVSNTENQNASVFGTLPFDAHLSFLNYTMDLNDTQNGGIVLPADGSWVTTSQLCFQSATDLSLAPLTCIEAVWGRDGLTNGYATAFVEVAEWESANVTGAAEGVGYEDITLSSQNNICRNKVCICDKPVLTVGEIFCNGTSYSVHFVHNGISISTPAGVVNGNTVVNIPVGVNVTITSSNGTGCTTSTTVTGPTSCPTTCIYSDLTVGQAICAGATYSVSFTETTGATISVSAGTRTGNMIVNIPLGSSVTITATNGLCVTNITVPSPSNCADPCANPLVSIGGTACTNNNTTYSINYAAIAGATITSSHGTVSNGVISGIPSGQAVTIIASFAGCAQEVVVVPAPVCSTGSIGNFVWHDLNGDGQQNAGETGIAGVQVNLYRSNGIYLATTYTDLNGMYIFNNLHPGQYYVEFISPTGFLNTFINKGNESTDSDVDRSNGHSTTATITLLSGQQDMSWDAGFYRCVPIGDLVWYDTNKNDIWDTNENGINGLRVNLWRNHFGTWLIWDHTFTGHKPNTPSDDGYWNFCAPPGEYFVEVIMPPLGLVRARANKGIIEENDSDITNANGPTTTDRFIVSSGQEKNDLGAGFYPQATAGNLVWVDANANGVQDAQEARMSGVLVEAVLLSTNQVAQSATTDIDGTYMIEGLEKQEYFLKFTPPAGYFATVPRAAADHMDSDVDNSNGPNTTRAFDMQPASAYENIDMGLAFAPLPVEWLDVTARRVNNTHIIEWTVARESNVSHYELERRFGSEKALYTIPGKVLAKGNTNEVTGYNLSDLDVDKSGIYVYRVKQYDFDGKSSYSKLVKVSHNGENSIELYPNPAKNETNVQIVVTQDAVVSVEMYDAASKLVKVIQVSDVQAAGDMIYNANLQDVPAGIYNIVITIDGVQTQKKLIRIE